MKHLERMKTEKHGTEKATKEEKRVEKKIVKDNDVIELSIVSV